MFGDYQHPPHTMSDRTDYGIWENYDKVLGVAKNNFAKDRTKRKIPATMVSQHPDHSSTPYWHDNPYIKTSDETKELFLDFSELGVGEYKWDWEGKLVDESVMERLLSEYYDYFKKHPLGEDKFLTFRLPNPRVETEFRLGRAFMCLITASQMAQQFSLPEIPLFEVILPMTVSSKEMIEINEAYIELVGLKHKLFRMDKMPLKTIKVIPLFEDIDTIANSAKILEEYINTFEKKFGRKPLYIRPYMARSDPALNSGIVPTVLSIKLALSSYQDLSQKTKIPLYPIIGAASLPFRGGLTPLTVEQFAKEYRGIRTTLLQSAFRYDYPKEIVIKAVQKLNKLLPKGEPQHISEQERKELLKVMKVFEKYYKETIEGLAELINKIASNLPKRRERVQHIGLFGYSRGVGKVRLPRAIGFTAALYSIGIPPELIGTGRGISHFAPLGALLEKYYLNFKDDLRRAGSYLNKGNLKELARENQVFKAIEEDVLALEEYLGEEFEPVTKEEKEHQKLTSKIYESLKKDKPVKELIEQAALLRKSLG